MAVPVLSRPTQFARFRDLAALGKPRLSAMVLFTSAIGVWLSPAAPTLSRTLVFLFATAGLVAAANTLNCWLESEVDGLMRRTRARPLPAGRLEPRTALRFGVTLAVASLSIISIATNTLTTLLGAVALFSYVLVYTPLKRITPWALLVGAIPGALPPLMGWTAATGRLAWPGWYLFGMLFFWQLPHFVAISLYMKDDFRRGGIRVLPLVHGDRVARICLFAGTVAVVAFGLVALPAGIAGPAYAWAAALVGAPWIVLTARGLGRTVSSNWARAVFAYSLVYLPLLATVLVLDAY